MAGADTERSIPYGSNGFLAHRLGVFPRRYRLFPIDKPGPVTGRMQVEVRCGVCGRLVPCLWESPPVYRRWLLRRLLAIWVAVVAVHIAAFLLLVSASPGDAAPIMALVLALESPLVIGGLLVSVAVFRDARWADSVRLRRRSRRHSFRTRGSMTPHNTGDDVWTLYRDTSFRDAAGI